MVNRLEQFVSVREALIKPNRQITHLKIPSAFPGTCHDTLHPDINEIFCSGKVVRRLPDRTNIYDLHFVFNLQKSRPRPGGVTCDRKVSAVSQSLVESMPSLVFVQTLVAP